uniref:Peptidase A2 domain-containing protein n=1 Tax=Astyanax mexicanus TaxID=7994 RepID=A0A3B1IVL0_ASTMX
PRTPARPGWRSSARPPPRRERVAGRRSRPAATRPSSPGRGARATRPDTVDSPDYVPQVQPTQISQVQRPVFMPETFTGSGRDWSDWSEQFEMAAEVNGWTDVLKLKFMSLLLTGRARDIYSGLATDEKGSYQNLKAALTKCFQPCDSAEWNRGLGVYISAKVGGNDEHLLIDTGAQVSIVSKKTWLDITEGRSDLQSYEGRVAVANGGEMEILGKWQTVCQFGALALVVEFLVADIPLGILLGMDFLQKYGAVIDLGEKQCTIMGKKIALLLRQSGAHTYSVSVHNDVFGPELLLSETGALLLVFMNYC